MLYNLFTFMHAREDAEHAFREAQLLKEVLGFHDDEINQLVSEQFEGNIVNNLTLEQAKEISDIFDDNHCLLFLNPGRYVEDIITWSELGISSVVRPPKAHYCDEPLISRDHLCDLSIPRSSINKPTTPTLDMPYNLFSPMWGVNDTFRKLLKEVLGYHKDEIRKMVSRPFGRNIVTNLTVEQAKEITEIFADNGFTLYLNPGRYEEDIVYWNQLGLSLSHHPPQAHYGDKPLVSRAHLYESSIPRSFFIKPDLAELGVAERLFARALSVLMSLAPEPRPAIECPYCHSTDTTKIGRMEIVLTEVVIGLLFGRHRFSPRRYKEWHCNHCGSDF